nr:protein trigalactosyldiacylglycerol 3, chloroplastic-like [Tanacetum cinerariifolium]
EERRDRVEFCLKRVGLENAGNKMPSDISGGMKKRVGIARAIAPNCTYLFCDEPNSGLDPATSIKIDELIHEITHEYNITTAIITHDMNSVVGIGEHIIFLHQGKKLWDGNKEEILNAEVPELREFIFSSSLGAQVAFTYLSSVEKGQALETELAAHGSKVKGYRSDASDYAQAEKLVDDVVKEFGKLDILVNNAGITQDGLLMRMSEEQWDNVLNVNLKSVFNL